MLESIGAKESSKYILAIIIIIIPLFTATSAPFAQSKDSACIYKFTDLHPLYNSFVVIMALIPIFWGKESGTREKEVVLGILQLAL